MGTEKRERQKANRQLKYEQQAKEQQRRKLTRTIVIGVAAVVGVLALVLFLALVVGGDDDDDAPTTTTTTPATTVASSTPDATTGGSVAPPSIVPFTYGDGPCPPDEVTEPVKEFEAAPEECIDPAATYTARFVTNMGDIVVELDTAEVPGTVNNFVTLAQYGYYDDTLIFRVEPSIGILQGGGENNQQSPGYDIPDEGTGFTYRPGQLVMARTPQPNSAGGQWFFTVTDAASGLDAGSGADGGGTYVVFGEVTEGFEITEQMLALAPASGDTPTETITVERVEITES